MTDPYAAPADSGPGEPSVPSDPWASGPGLGSSAAGESVPDPAAAPGIVGPPVPQPPAPAWPAAAQPPAPAWPPTPGTGPYEQPAPAPQVSYQQPPYAATYPEPDGPASQIGNPYAPSVYAGQRLPAITDPVAYDYGYSRPQGGSPHPQAATSMVLGILGLVAFTPLAPVAWYIAAKARREMAAEPYRWEPSGMVTAGLVMGIIGTVLMALFAVFFVLVFVLAAASGF